MIDYEFVDEPIPEQTRESKYPRWREMKVGQCVYIPRENAAGPGASCARAYGHKYGMKFRCRTDGVGTDDREWGVYIWRIA